MTISNVVVQYALPSFVCIGSGESGAGKTESCKFIVTHLTELSHAKSLVEQRIIQVWSCVVMATCTYSYGRLCSTGEPPSGSLWKCNNCYE